MNRWIVLVAMALLTIGMVGCDKGSEEETAANKKKIVVSEGSEQMAGNAEQTAETDSEPVDAECRVDLTVDGMVCEHGCSPKVMKALEGVDGVAKVNVSYEKKHAEVLGDGDVCSEVGAEKLIDALKHEKYDGKVEKIEPLQG